MVLSKFFTCNSINMLYRKSKYLITLKMYFYFCRKNNSITCANENSYFKLKNPAYRFLRKKIILLLIIVVLSGTCPAQQGSKIDSLIKVLSTQKEDSNKVKTLNTLSMQLWQKASYTEAKKNADDAL